MLWGEKDSWASYAVVRAMQIRFPTLARQKFGGPLLKRFRNVVKNGVTAFCPLAIPMMTKVFHDLHRWKQPSGFSAVTKPCTRFSSCAEIWS